MRTKLTVLAVTALLALGTGSAVAAMDTPTSDTASDDALPAKHTVDVINTGEVNYEEIDLAVETAWANDTVQDYFDDDVAVHFEVWASRLDDDVIHVKVAPIQNPDKTRVIADISLSGQQVTYIDEPVKLNASNAVTINASDYDLTDTDHSQDTSDEKNTSEGTIDQTTQIDLNESSIERDGDGTFTFEIENNGGNTTTPVPSDEIVRISLQPEDSTEADK